MSQAPTKYSAGDHVYYEYDLSEEEDADADTPSRIVGAIVRIDDVRRHYWDNSWVYIGRKFIPRTSRLSGETFPLTTANIICKIRVPIYQFEQLLLQEMIMKLQFTQPFYRGKGQSLPAWRLSYARFELLKKQIAAGGVPDGSAWGQWR